MLSFLCFVEIEIKFFKKKGRRYNARRPSQEKDFLTFLS